MKIAYASNGKEARLVGSKVYPWEVARALSSAPENTRYFVLDTEMCLAIADKVPKWGRHLQRLCGKFEGRVPLGQSLLINIMGCQFQYEGEALTSRWEGGRVPGFCSEECRQFTREYRCDHKRCAALQAPRAPGKLCFMELVEAVAGALPGRLAIGDPIVTASWGEFVVMDYCVKVWLNDYSSYFHDICGSSWDAAVALHVDAWPNRRGGHRLVTRYACALCGEERMAAKFMHGLRLDVKFAVHQQCPDGELFCLECTQKASRQTPCRFYCGSFSCAGRCANGAVVGAEIKSGPDYNWGH